MVEHFNESPRHCSNGHHGATKAMEPPSESSPALLQQAYEYPKTKAVFLALSVAAVLASSIFDNMLHVKVPIFIRNIAGNVASTTVDTVYICVTLVAAGLACLAYNFIFVPGPLLLLDFACFKPDESTSVSKQLCVEKAHRSGYFTESSLEFMEKVLYLSGLGDETCTPPSALCEPIDRSQKACHAEVQEVIFGVADEIFAQGTVKPKDVGILVVNCSVYTPLPSLASMVVNKYKMRKDTEVFNLGGMGCSAGLIAVDLARRMLQVRRNSYALVVSLEAVSGMHIYPGNKRSMMVGNCLFRSGASAVLLSNRKADRWRAKYELQHLVRTHNGADDASYNCVHSEQDEAGNIGVSISRDLMRAAGSALKDNITTLAPKILPLSEKVKFAINYIFVKFNKTPQPASYVPDFTKAVSHFVVHPGGKAVLDGVAEKLALDDWCMEPSRMTLHRFGNTSSSSVWYVLAYLEAKGRVKKGHTVWQIALGSGLKCNSAVWKSLRSSQQGPSTNVWAQIIDKYPTEIVTTLPEKSCLRDVVG